MEIEKVRIKNFRSFGKEIVLKAKPGLNIIIGENNVGKSNIFIALNKLKHVLISREYTLMRGNQGTAIFFKDDFSWGKSDDQIEIFVSLILNEKELDELINLFIISYPKNIEDKRLENFKKEMGNKIEIFLKSNRKEKKLPYFKIGPLFFDISNRASIDPNSFHLGSYEGIEWKNLIYSSFTGKRDFSEKIKVVGKNKVIEFKNKNISDFIINMFSKKLKMFEEVRKKPEEKIKYEDEAIDGTEIAKLLFRLKNGNLTEKERYGLIQEKFNELFPNLNLDVSYKEKEGKPIVLINPKGSRHEFPLEFIGTGVMEMIIFLTNIVALKGNVFLIEEPELHLHPSAQRSLLKLLQEYKNENQFFLITHSPYLINIEDLTENILVKMKDGKSIIKQIPENYFNEREKAKIEKELDSGDKEMFFSSLVLLVEGETESGALPIFAKALDTDLDKNNVYICWVGGKKSFPLFQKILNVYDIPHIIVCDGNAQGIDEDKLIVFDPDFEEVLKRCGYESFLIEAGNKVGTKSKPRKGRYVAKKIVELNKDIPDEFKEIIKKVRKVLGLEKK